MTNDSIEKILEIYKVPDLLNANTWNPGIKSIKNHEISPLWVASVMLLVYDFYLSQVKDADQNNFTSETLDILKTIQEIGIESVITHKIC